MPENLLQVQNASKTYAAKVLFENAQFSVNDDEHIGVIGANGAGKSTLFKILVGRENFDAGQIIKKKGLQIGYLGQEEHHVAAGPVDEMMIQASRIPVWEAKRIGHGLGLREEHYRAPYPSLSGGYRMRIQLLLLLSQTPDLLLLDEPTNYLDLESLLVLEKFLINYKSAFMLISHDREFLKRTTDHILEIENGQMTKFAGHIEDYFEQKQMLREQIEKTAAGIDEKRQQILAFATRFGAKASKARQAQSKLKQLDKLQPIEVSALPVAAKIRIPEPKHIGKLALSVAKASFGYGDRTILKPFSFNLQKGDRAAIVGVNGAGKSTLLKGLAGVLAPLTGEVSLGYQVEIGYYAQHVAENLDPDCTVLEEMMSAAGHDAVLQQVKDLAGSLLFSGDDVQKRVRVLSGGEKARVALAQILLKKAPVLLLDEPTNHLDFHTVEALTEALRDYGGTVVVVSHDRSFIRRVADKIVEIRDGSVDVYPGTYDEYVWSTQKGVWAEKDAASDERPSSTAGPSEKKWNYKEQKKVLTAQLRQTTKEFEKTEARMEEKRKRLDELNEGLMRAQGPEAGALARELGLLQKEIELLESDWIALSEKMERQENEIRAFENA